ncbi:outer membrane receptor for ferrienterochelin and colicins [Lampropedia hyalina DSM 16112]|jgi:ferric enterobactin receptor|uniref:Outer membrane receptor for ferrienterochelin and colicins n=1 Tax=Lampropedia hyalina DSM 16112 TaxID=1122156 RepID=A0A1M4ZGV8_9BURK|nr:FepA family TonB-dependent siderophore receptor [Lampropedia hyalina]SHF16826.1 outer membrane receptor for ferrienterochelin and colicins [Lampropedia hyalina DSM 16112]
MARHHRLAEARIFVPCLIAAAIQAAHAQDSSATVEDIQTLPEVEVVAASEQVKQAPGVSTVTTEDIERTPVTNDISEIVRRQPGVNLTGNSSTGARGNNRQIDIRGMGPENTLILIDGKPVLSRNSVRMSTQGERDTRGDSNWVPPEAIESIEVLRGPAAARYGSGAAGGVVNIRTKAATRKAFTVSAYTNVPENSKEGDTRRINVLASGPVNEALSYRLYGNFNVTDHDKFGLNPVEVTTDRGTNYNYSGGREGVQNRDLSARLSYRLNPDHRFDLDAGWSRQGNKFAGDTQNNFFDGDTEGNPDPNFMSLFGKETNRVTRTTAALTHFGNYRFGTSESYIQYERSDNRRYAESLGGGYEGAIEADDLRWTRIRLNNINAKSEFNIPLTLGYEQVLTLGAEVRRESMTDPVSITNSLTPGLGIGTTPEDAANRSNKSDATLIGIYVEDNIYVGDAVVLTPGLRFDHHSEFGTNWSPSLNAAWQLDGQFSLKGGIARAYKAPNLYQLNPNYVYQSGGRGCWNLVGPCSIMGNPDLDPEISLNKEIGLSFENDTGWVAGITYFHNRFRNRIGSGRQILNSVDVETPCWWAGCAGSSISTNVLQQWENSGPATVAGVEGNLTVPVARTLEWSSNFTYMSKSEDDRGQPLSLVPEYTINSWLNWQTTSRLAVNLGLTHYGRIDARAINLTTNEPELVTDARSAYTLVNLGLNYQINKTFRVNGGVKNLFDKQLLRTSQGANTFNEPGRSYHLSLTAAF